MVHQDAAILQAAVDPQLGMVVVIPALAEPDLLSTLDALQCCEMPACGVEIVVLINNAMAAEGAVREANQRLFEQCLERGQGDIPEHVVLCSDLPDRHAGVGLARKLGLDLGLQRLLESRSAEGLLVSLDADCDVDANYLIAIEAHFQSKPECVGASIYFEHPLGPAQQPDAIAGYELHLRYFVHALRYAGMPHVFHTVGSCMVVRSQAYMSQGGMNRRQAGEDYYFVQKLAATGGFSDLTGTTVYPSSRQSWRVPFGTGRAMESWDGGYWPTYAPQIFDEMSQWLAAIPQFYQGDRDALMDKMPDNIQRFLDSYQWRERLEEIAANTASGQAFVTRVQRWFNNFTSMKFVHFATDQSWPKVPVTEAAAQLLDRLPGAHRIVMDNQETSAQALLQVYRQRCRAG